MSTAEGGTQTLKEGLKLHVDFSNRKSYSPNLMNYSIWSAGSGSIVGNNALYGITEYTLNGSAAENIRVVDQDPFGYTSSIVWRSSTVDEALVSPNQADGGWNSGFISIDSSKTYRFSVWAKKNTGIANSGTIYLGHTPGLPIGATWSVLKNTGSIAEGTNPYFHYVEPVSPPSLGGADVWTLIVGHIWPSSTAPGTIEPGSNISNPSLAANYAHPDSGVWTASSGKVGNLRFSESTVADNSSDWIWNPFATRVRHRTYLFYGATMTPPATASFIYPRIDVVDGFEPTIQELLRGPEPVRNLAEPGTGFALHHTNYSNSSNGCIRNEKNKFMGFHGTMSTSFTLYSASIWFRPDSTITNVSTGQALVQFSSTLSDPFGIYVGDATQLLTGDVILIAGSNTITNARTAVANISISGGQWHNITINWETGIGSAYAIYLDGVKQITTSAPQINVPLLTTNGYAVIGGRFSTAAAPIGFDGRLASVMAWNRSLSQAEISAMYRAGKAKLG